MMKILYLPLFASLSIFILNGCAVYEVDSASHNTLSGSLNRAVNKDRGRVAKDNQKYKEAPRYIDYSKSNPILRHDDEFNEDKKIQSDDPFEETVDFSDYKKMKKKQQDTRNMKEKHEVSNDPDAPVSLW